MEIRYRNDLYGNYMLIEVPENVDSSQYAFKMLEKNRISGVLLGKERMEDGKKYWYVDISRKKNLIQEYQDKEMQLEDMIILFQEIIPVLEEIRKYLLNESMVVMDPQFIYKDLDDNRIHILILPWKQEEKTIHKLAEFFLEKINHRDDNGVNAAYHFYRQQNQSQFSFYQFLPILEKESILKRKKDNLSKEDVPIIHREISEKTKEEFIYDNNEDKNLAEKKPKEKLNILFLLLPILIALFSFLPKVNFIIKISCRAFSFLMLIVFFVLFLSKRKKTGKEEKNDNWEEYCIREPESVMKETVFFDSSENENYIKLLWKEKGRKKQFILKDFPCTIGKIKEEVSLVITDPSVSRVHCRFVEKENKVYLMDLNSTNGTYLNGLILKNGEIQEIEKNDEILICKVRISVV